MDSIVRILTYMKVALNNAIKAKEIYFAEYHGIEARTATDQIYLSLSEAITNLQDALDAYQRK